MRTLDIAKRSGRSLRTARARTLLTAFAIAVGAFALTLTLGASNGVQHYADTIISDNFDPSELIVTADGGVFDRADTSTPQEYSANYGSVLTQRGSSMQIKMLGDPDVTRIRALPGISTVRPVDSLSLQYVTRDGQRKYVATAQSYDASRPPELLAGSVPHGLESGQVLVPEGFVSSLGFASPADAIGKKIRLAVKPQADQASLLQAFQNGGGLPQNDTVEREFTVAAVNKKPPSLIQAGSGLYLSLPVANLEQLNDSATKGTTNYHKYLSVFATVKDGTDKAKLTSAQDELKKAGYQAQSILDTQKTIGQVINVLQGIVTVFGLIAVVASVFGVVNTMYISVLQRTREIGLMKALGMHKLDISKLFLFEAGLIGLLGGLIGTGLAVGGGLIMNPFISKWLDIGSVRIIIYEPLQLALLVLGLSLIAVLAGLFPALKAARLDPIEALRTE